MIRFFSVVITAALLASGLAFASEERLLSPAQGDSLALDQIADSIRSGDPLIAGIKDNAADKKPHLLARQLVLKRRLEELRKLRDAYFGRNPR